MSAQSEKRIVPETVTHDEFMAAIKPLLDLLNVTDQEVWPELHITPPSRGSTSLAVISLPVVARRFRGDDGAYPEGIILGSAPQATAELCYHVSVEVV